VDGITRYLSVLDPDRVFVPEALEEEIVDGWIHSIVNREFGFKLFHDFPREKGTPPIRVVSQDWRYHIEASRARHIRRLDRLMALDRAENRILFVRHEPDEWNGQSSTHEIIEGLWRVLTNRWSSAQVDLLLINFPAFDSPSTRILTTALDDLPGPPNDPWRGNDAAWATALASLGMIPINEQNHEPRLSSPGEED
jgi:hypothetical protein